MRVRVRVRVCVCVCMHVGDSLWLGLYPQSRGGGLLVSPSAIGRNRWRKVLVFKDQMEVFGRGGERDVVEDQG